MKLEFCDTKINFGDSLNKWLWPKVIEKKFNAESDVCFLGIGTIITDKRLLKIKNVSQAIIFSSGAWGNKNYSLDENWKVYGVRGPRTAKALGLTQDYVVGDGAYLLRNFYPSSDGSGSSIGFIPHHGSEMFVDWQSICKKVGLKFITPKQHTESFIEELYSCKFVITEAMHGAIAADALRIPWKAVKFAPNFSSFKWHDWAEALKVKLEINEIPFVVSSNIAANRMVEDFFKYYLKKIYPGRETDRVNVYKEKKIKNNNINKIKEKLLILKEGGFQLSRDEDFKFILNRLNAQVVRINDDINSGVIL